MSTRPIIPIIVDENPEEAAQNTSLQEASQQFFEENIITTQRLIDQVEERGMAATVGDILARTRDLLVHIELDMLEIGSAMVFLSQGAWENEEVKGDSLTFKSWLHTQGLDTPFIQYCMKFFHVYQQCITVKLPAEELLILGYEPQKLGMIDRNVAKYKREVDFLEKRNPDDTPLLQAALREKAERAKGELEYILKTDVDKLKHDAALAMALPNEMPPVNVIWRMEKRGEKLFVSFDVPCDRGTICALNLNQRINRKVTFPGVSEITTLEEFIAFADREHLFSSPKEDEPL